MQTERKPHPEGPSSIPVSRRRFLAATAGGLAAGLTGSFGALSKLWAGEGGEAEVQQQSPFVITESIVVYDQQKAWPGGVTVAPDGHLVVTWGRVVGDWGAGGKPEVIHSTDGGHTWSKSEVIGVTQRGPKGSLGGSLGLLTTSKGSILQPAYDFLSVPPKDEEGNWNLRLCTDYVFKSTDNGYTWTRHEVDTAGALEAFMYGKIIELRDGRLLCPLWGVFAEGEPARSALVKSFDDGETWGDYTTIAFDPDAARWLNNETSLIELRNGDILAIIRNGLRRSISTDKGETWSPPEQTEIRGTSPSLHRAPSGRIILGYRDSEAPRPVAISWSEDEGKTWLGKLRLQDPKGINYEAWAKDHEGAVGGYPSFTNLPDGRIFVIFYSTDERGIYIAANILEEVA